MPPQPAGPRRRGALPVRRAAHAAAARCGSSEVAQTTFEHVYEVDPRLMEVHVLQQVFPNWDTLRIMRSRHDHLAWMHRHFAEKVVTGSEILAEVERETATAAAAVATTGFDAPSRLIARD